jgi:hypothetical protein
MVYSMKVKQTNMEEDLLSGILLLRNIQVCVCVCECLSICQKKIMINIYMRSYESIWKYFKPLNLDRLDPLLPFIYKFQCAFSLDKLTIYYPSPFLLIKHLDGW